MIALGLIALFFALAAAASSHAPSPPTRTVAPAVGGPPPLTACTEVGKLVKLIGMARVGRLTMSQLVQAARLAAKLNYPQTARELYGQAVRKREQADLWEGVAATATAYALGSAPAHDEPDEEPDEGPDDLPRPAKPARAKPMLNSPFAEWQPEGHPAVIVPGEAWTAYARGSRIARQSAVSEAWHLGYFQLGARALQDIGLMVGVKRVPLDDRRFKWQGEWVPPYDTDSFLAAPNVQYGAFVALTKLHAEQIRQQLPEAVGRDVDGAKATLSGLLAVAKQAGGLRGLHSWLTNAADRRKFVNTTQAFKRLNGLF